jgi:hypothetical protein
MGVCACSNYAAAVAAFLLTLVGSVCALVAAIVGIRMKPEDFRMDDEAGRAVFGAERIVNAIKQASWWLLFGGLAALAATVIQGVNLLDS